MMWTHCGFLLLLFTVISVQSLSSNGMKNLSPAADIAADVTSSRSMTSASSGDNLSGCPRLPANCNFDCLTIGTNGCIQCTCAASGKGTGSSVPDSHSSSSLAGAHSGDNLNGCPVFTAGCSAECLTLDIQGCPICSCHSTTGSNTGPSSTGTGQVSGSQMTSSMSSANGNNAGCPAFPTNCQSDCVSLSDMGCPLCSCTSGSAGNQTASSSTSSVSSMTSAQTSSNLNGCPAFPNTCRAECLDLSPEGCPICTCKSSSSAGSSLNTHNTGAIGGSISSNNNNNGCPDFHAGCPARCTTINDQGCPICTCQATSSNSQVTTTAVLGIPISTTPSTTGTDGKPCPPLIVGCREACLFTDSYGCILCNGDCNVNNNIPTTTIMPPLTSSSTLSQIGSTAAPGVDCPSFNSGSCPISCASFDKRGCLTCSCRAGTTPGVGTSGNIANGCRPFDVACPSGCAAVDANGCLYCKCPIPSNSTPTALPVPTVPSTSGPQVSPMIPGTTRSPAVISCPAFDGAHCNPACMGLDAKGCLQCECGATAQPGSTSPPATKQSPAGSPLTTFAPGLSGGQQTGSSGTGTINNCAPFDASCPINCAQLDSLGCLVCSCGPTSTRSTRPATPQSTTPGLTSAPGLTPTVPALQTTSPPLTTFAPGLTGNTAPGTNGTSNCPTFDPACKPTCAKVDAQGCVVCNCGNTSVTGGNSGGSGCPAYNTSCPVTCTRLDAMGCLTCAKPCSGTVSGISTPAPILGSTASPVQPGTGCQRFDTSCPITCVSMDARGCPSCTCSSGGGTDSGNGSGCPAFDTTCSVQCTSMNSQGCPVCICSQLSSVQPVPVSSQPASTDITPPTPVHTEITPPTPVHTDITPPTPVHTDITPPTPLSTEGTTIPTTTMAPVTIACQKFDETCPRACTSIDANGCLKCTCTTTTASTTTKKDTTPVLTPKTTPRPQIPTTRASPVTTTRVPQITTTHVQTTSAVRTCPPIRCIYPCDVGVSLGPDNCPVCKCRTVTTTAAP